MYIVLHYKLYQLERRQGKLFSLHDIEQNFFEIDEELGRDKKVSRNERALAISDHRQKRGNNNTNKHKGSQGRSSTHRFHRPPHKSHPSSAHAANGDVVCFKCGAPGHIASNCPQLKQKPKPPNTSARGNAATGTTSQECQTTELVCMVRTLQLEQANSARRVFNYENHPNIARP